MRGIIEPKVNCRIMVLEKARKVGNMYVGGNIIHDELRHNLVVDSGLNLIRDWFYGAGESRTVKYIGVGNVAGAISMTETQTWLNKPVAFFPFSRKLEDVGRVRMLAYIGENEYNGQDFSEVGLFTGQNPEQDVMYARCQHERLYKNDTRIFAYIWECRWDLG